jgi:hypothetical protein
MTDGRDNRMPDQYDDDRLLACALGLEEDPELLAAAAVDADLGARLEAMRADVAAIGVKVAAAVPEPEQGYTDLSGDRWGSLREYLDAPAEAKPRRERRWWRVLAPVAALVVLALVVGIVAVNGGGLGGSGSSTSGEAQTADSAAPAQSFSGTGVTKGGEAGPSQKTLRERFSDELDRFATVVLARARQATGAVQRFAVLRIFKGAAPKMVELAVNGEPTDAGRLHLLMLDPTAAPEAQDETPWPLTESPVPGSESPLPETVSPPPSESPLPTTLSPEPIPSLAAADGPGEELAVSYTYQGEPTVIREFAPGTDPSSVDITIP